MKYSIFKRALLATSIIGLSVSCTDLEEEIFDQLTVENFPRSEADYAAALGAAYTGLYPFGNNNNVWGLQEISSDEVVVPTRGTDWGDGGQWRQIHNHEFTVENPLINGGWTFCFGGVATCNRLIFQFEQLGTPGTEIAISELRALRALYYLWLIDLYGNVPIVEDFAGADPNPSNNSRAEVFSFIESELSDDVLANLSQESGGAAYSKVNYWTAKMILAKLYLNAEVYTGTPRYDEAEEIIDEIINSGNYSLAGDYFSMFSANNEGSPETIFAIPYDEIFAPGFNLPMMTLHYGSQATYNLTQQPWNGFCSLQEFYESYDDNDVRKSVNFIEGPQFTSGNAPVIDDSAEAEDPDGPQVNFTPNIDALDDALRQQGVRIGKYEFELGATDNLNNDFPIFRYTDVLLMKAEVALRRGDQATALNMTNMVRARAGAEEYEVLTLDELLAERGREMFVEAHRRTDLIRFGAFDDPWWEKGATQDFKSLFPIPAQQLNANSNLQQNEGY